MMTREKYEVMKTAEGEGELLELIRKALESAERDAARRSNAGEGEGKHFYYLSLAYNHAVKYIEDQEDSL